MNEVKHTLKDIETLDLLREMEDRGHYAWVVSMGDVDLICEEQELDLTSEEKMLILSHWKAQGDTLAFIHLEARTAIFNEMEQ